jgi:hypothetical protein
LSGPWATFSAKTLCFTLASLVALDCEHLAVVEGGRVPLEEASASGTTPRKGMRESVGAVSQIAKPRGPVGRLKTGLGLMWAPGHEDIDGAVKVR